MWSGRRKIFLMLVVVSRGSVAYSKMRHPSYTRNVSYTCGDYAIMLHSCSTSSPRKYFSLYYPSRQLPLCALNTNPVSFPVPASSSRIFVLQEILCCLAANPTLECGTALPHQLSGCAPQHHLISSFFSSHLFPVFFLFSCGDTHRVCTGK